MKHLYKFLLNAALILSAINASASDKYCSAASSAKSFDIHVFGYTYKDNNAKKQMAQGLTDLYKNLGVGDRVKVYNHNATGYNLSMDQCVPGCADAGFFDSLLNSSCSAEVAKRDRKTFGQRFAQATMSDLNRGGESYDIFKAVQDLNDVYKDGKTNSTVAVAISMIPDGINPTVPAEFNKFYVTKVPDLKIALEFPPVCTVGTSPNSEVLKFWRDVFSIKKVKFDFKPCSHE